MLPLLQVGQDEPLPVDVQHIPAAGRVKFQAAPPLPRLQQEVDLRIVAQGLKVAHPFHSVLYGLLVHDAPLVKGDRRSKPLLYQGFQHIYLHLPHDLGVDFFCLLPPHNVELRYLLLQRLQLQIEAVHIAGSRGKHPVGEDRLQHREDRGCLVSKPLAGIRPLQPGDSADHAGARLLHGLKTVSGVDPDLVHLLACPPLACSFLTGLLLTARFPCTGVRHVLVQVHLHPQASPGHLQVGQPLTGGIPCDLVHPGAKLLRIPRIFHIISQSLKEHLHSLHLQRRAKETGKNPPLSYQLPDALLVRGLSLQEPLQQRLVVEGHPLIEILRIREVLALVGEPLFQLLHERPLIRPLLVHLVDKEEDRDMISLQEMPQRLHMPLDAVRAADDKDRVVQHLQGPLHLRREIHMPRRVQEGHLLIPDDRLRLLGKNGDPPVLFHLVCIQEGVPVVHPPQLSYLARGV